jgi:hypothetical protein
MQPVGVDTEPVSQAQRPHQQDSSQNAIVLPTPTRALYGRRDHQWLCMATGQFANGNVFHQRDCGKGAESVKKIARKEQALIATCNPGYAAAKIDRGFDYSVYDGFVIKAKMKVPPGGCSRNLLA